MKFFLLPVAALACGLGGCVDSSNLSFSIDKAIAISQDNGCMPTTSGTGTAFGIYDVGLASQGVGSPGFAEGYQVAPEVVNHLVGQIAAGQVEMNSIDLTGFDVQLKPPADDPRLATALPANLRSFFVPRAGGRITPSSSVVLFVEVLPVDLAKALNAALQAQDPNNMTPTHAMTVHMRPVGSHAGLVIDGGFFDFPVQICRFCLSKPLPCPTGGFPPDTVTMSAACFPAQDASSTCCTQNGLLLCGAALPLSTSM